MSCLSMSSLPNIHLLPRAPQGERVKLAKGETRPVLALEAAKDLIKADSVARLEMSISFVTRLVREPLSLHYFEAAACGGRGRL